MTQPRLQAALVMAPSYIPVTGQVNTSPALFLRSWAPAQLQSYFTFFPLGIVRKATDVILQHYYSFETAENTLVIFFEI